LFCFLSRVGFSTDKSTNKTETAFEQRLLGIHLRIGWFSQGAAVVVLYSISEWLEARAAAKVFATQDRVRSEMRLFIHYLLI
jgi:hypothetical protein